MNLDLLLFLNKIESQVFHEAEHEANAPSLPHVVEWTGIKKESSPHWKFIWSWKNSHRVLIFFCFLFFCLVTFEVVRAHSSPLWGLVSETSHLGPVVVMRTKMREIKRLLIAKGAVNRKMLVFQLLASGAPLCWAQPPLPGALPQDKWGPGHPGVWEWVGGFVLCKQTRRKGRSILWEFHRKELIGKYLGDLIWWHPWEGGTPLRACCTPRVQQPQWLGGDVTSVLQVTNSRAVPGVENYGNLVLRTQISLGYALESPVSCPGSRNRPTSSK